MNKKLLIALAVLMVATMACSVNLGSTPTATPIVIATNPPQPTTENVQPTAVVVIPTTVQSNSGSILFQDDFSDTSSGWDRITDNSGVTDYVSGGYRIYITVANTSLWANPGRNFPNDVVIDVDATEIGGSDVNAFGAICRYQDTDNFVKFYLTSDGYAGIATKVNGASTVISSSDGMLQPVDGILSGSATNHLRAECIGNTYNLYANGNLVSTATDTNFQNGGDVGLRASTYDTVGTDFVFSNFVVTAP